MVYVIVGLGAALYLSVAVNVGQRIALVAQSQEIEEREQERLRQMRQIAALQRDLKEAKAKGGAA